MGSRNYPNSVIEAIHVPFLQLSVLGFHEYSYIRVHKLTITKRHTCPSYYPRLSSTPVKIPTKMTYILEVIYKVSQVKLFSAPLIISAMELCKVWCQ